MTKYDCNYTFEEWAKLDPAYDLAKDGDGEYEDPHTRRQYLAYAAGHKAGIWGAANKINGELCDGVGRLEQENERLRKALAEYANAEHVRTHQGNDEPGYTVRVWTSTWAAAKRLLNPTRDTRGEEA